jgi:hypothetical protein
MNFQCWGEQVITGVKAALKDPTTVYRDSMREITVRDVVSSREWVGNKSFVTRPEYSVLAVVCVGSCRTRDILELEDR